MNAPLSTRMRRGTITCPVCGGPLRIDYSREQTPAVKDLYVVCGNSHCGASFKHQVALVYMISPSAMPYEHLGIPQAPPGHVPRRYLHPGEGPDPDQIDLFEDDPPELNSDQIAA